MTISSTIAPSGVVVPRMLQRYRMPAAVTSVALGLVAGAGFGLFTAILGLLATLGIAVRGLELDVVELRREAVFLTQHGVVGAAAIAVTALLATSRCSSRHGLPSSWRSRLGAFVVGVAARNFRRQLPVVGSDRTLHAVELFATFFVPFYFFHAGLGLRREDFGPGALLVGMEPPALEVMDGPSLHSASVEGE